MPALEAVGLIKHFSGARVVDGVDLACEAGMVLGLLGPNGAGKTTTLRMLYGLLQPDAGSIRYGGEDFSSRRYELKRAIGVCTQDDTLDEEFSVRENLERFARFFRPAPSDLQRRIDGLIARFGLEPHARQRPETLSGGFRRRLMIARAVVHAPRVLFLDEPTTGLDPQSRRQLWELIGRFKSEGRSILLTTHYMDEAERLCDRVAVVDHGKMIALGPPQTLIRENFHETALEFSTNEHLPMDQLQTLPFVESIQAENGITTLYSNGVSRTTNALMALAEERNTELKGFAFRMATLEDVFLKLTGRRIRD